MIKFIELTVDEEKKCLININTINEIWKNPKGGTYVSTNSNDGSIYQETYDEIKEMLRDILNN